MDPNDPENSQKNLKSATYLTALGFAARQAGRPDSPL